MLLISGNAALILRAANIVLTCRPRSGATPTGNVRGASRSTTRHLDALDAGTVSPGPELMLVCTLDGAHGDGLDATAVTCKQHGATSSASESASPRGAIGWALPPRANNTAVGATSPAMTAGDFCRLLANRCRPTDKHLTGKSRNSHDLITLGDSTTSSLALVHRSCPATAQIFAAAGGCSCRYAISHTEGATFGPHPTVEDIAGNWNRIRDGSLPNELDGEAMAWGVKAYSARPARPCPWAPALHIGQVLDAGANRNAPAGGSGRRSSIDIASSTRAT